MAKRGMACQSELTVLISAVRAEHDVSAKRMHTPGGLVGSQAVTVAVPLPVAGRNVWFLVAFLATCSPPVIDLRSQHCPAVCQCAGFECMLR
jgi:hypothetical protein